MDATSSAAAGDVYHNDIPVPMTDLAQIRQIIDQLFEILSRQKAYPDDVENNHKLVMYTFALNVLRNKIWSNSPLKK